jgi:hypothetical protein
MFKTHVVDESINKYDSYFKEFVLHWVLEKRRLNLVGQMERNYTGLNQIALL